MAKLRGLAQIGFLSLAGVAHLLAAPSSFAAPGGLEWGRFQLGPEVSVAESYTDNLFLTEEDEEEEFINTISPKLALSFAITPADHLGLAYQADVDTYHKRDELNRIGHRAKLSYAGTRSSGSQYRLGAELQDRAIPPLAKTERDKNYRTERGFLDSEIRLGPVSALDLGYDYLRRRFENDLNEGDDFDRHSIRAGFVYDRFPLTSLLCQYSFLTQDNNDPGGTSTDMKTHTVFAGFRRKPAARLSGSLKGGYTKTDVEDFEGFSGLALEGDLVYDLSGLSHLTLTLFRNLVSSTAAERETNIYYISTGATIDLAYRRWPRVELGTSLSGRRNDFQGAEDLLGGERTDDYYSAALRAKYALTSWVSSAVEYRIRDNDSTVDGYGYRENIIELRLHFHMREI
ncbi:MAG: hypothetical protein C4519_21500 [Desulfobacteraceae bacterium]|nr:MAG: hypothetical protein C4519_21500 [Desulfobacteraceae bacterium]